MSNQLIHATSPYLLQHAHNPVHWQEWNQEALAHAKLANKPILVSIGYSSCHWCHVMERESFEHNDIAAIMNEHFVCIKVDREERPDIDQIYMEAVQAMGMNGGWPLNVFLTPDQKPFYGGTYFPPKQWAQVLINVGKAWREKQSEIIESANDLSNHLNSSDLQRFSGLATKPDLAVAEAMFQELKNRFDTVYGGQDKAPKFIMPTIWSWLLRYYYITKNTEALNMADHTLTMAACGGLFDQLGGGFARYSVDAQWFAPHFEKMLYDNGQLLSLYAELYTISKKELHADVLNKTINWLADEMTHAEGGFYSALDADSEGVEGKYYGWTWDEFRSVVGGDDADLLCAWFNLKETGNWEHGMNILTVPDSPAEFAASAQLDVAAIKQKVQAASVKLLTHRNKRVKPGLDDKILTGWNAMTIAGLVDAALALQNDTPLAMAQRAMKFIEKNLIHNRICYRSFKGRASATEGFLEDYAFLIQAYTKLYQATFQEDHLKQAGHWCQHTLNHFYDAAEGYFHFTSNHAEPLIARKKEIFDNVIPSGNSVMARNLLVLSDLLDKPDWHAIAITMITPLGGLMAKEPAYTSNWGMAMLESVQGFTEVAISGSECHALRQAFGATHLPFTLFAGSTEPSTLPLLIDRAPKADTLIYACRNRTCSLPVSTITEALVEIKGK
jgi:uncharacterized protein